MSDYKENGVDITTKFEFYADSEGVSVTNSLFSDSSGTFKQNGSDLRTALAGTLPTSANSYLGGANTSERYKHNGTYIDVALYGCRPMGKFVYTINASVGSDVTYYINRVNNQTWLSTSQGSASGTRLSHDPLFLHIELQGGGASGAARKLANYRRGGGSGGGYVYCPVAIPENGYLKIVVGRGGAKKEAGDTSQVGNHGGATTLYVGTTQLASAGGGYRAGDLDHMYDGGEENDHKGIEGGDVNINGTTTTTYVKSINALTSQGYRAYGYKGGYSGGSETRFNESETLAQINVPFSVPEGRTETHGPIPGWECLNNSAGSGGNSYFAQGAKRSTEEGRDGTLGSGGGSGANSSGSGRAGGKGGPGLVKIWY